MATDAELVAKYREKAKDKTLPQDVKNMYLDKAVEIEQKSYKQMKTPAKMAKGGMPVKGSRTATNKAKKMMGGGYAMKTPAMAKGGAVKKKGK